VPKSNWTLTSKSHTAKTMVCHRTPNMIKLILLVIRQNLVLADTQTAETLLDQVSSCDKSKGGDMRKTWSLDGSMKNIKLYLNPSSVCSEFKFVCMLAQVYLGQQSVKVRWEEWGMKRLFWGNHREKPHFSNQKASNKEFYLTRITRSVVCHRAFVWILSLEFIFQDLGYYNSCCHSYSLKLFFFGYLSIPPCALFQFVSAWFLFSFCMSYSFLCISLSF